MRAGRGRGRTRRRSTDPERSPEELARESGLADAQAATGVREDVYLADPHPDLATGAYAQPGAKITTVREAPPGKTTRSLWKALDMWDGFVGTLPQWMRRTGPDGSVVVQAQKKSGGLHEAMSSVEPTVHALGGENPLTMQVTDAQGRVRTVVDVPGTESVARLRRKIAAAEGREPVELTPTAWIDGTKDPSIQAIIKLAEANGVPRETLNRISEHMSWSFRSGLRDLGLLDADAPLSHNRVESLNFYGEAVHVRRGLEQYIKERASEASENLLNRLGSDDLNLIRSGEGENRLPGIRDNLLWDLEGYDPARWTQLTPEGQAVLAEARGFISVRERYTPQEWFSRQAYKGDLAAAKIEAGMDQVFSTADDLVALGVNRMTAAEFVRAHRAGEIDAHIPTILAEGIRDNAVLLNRADKEFSWLREIGKADQRTGRDAETGLLGDIARYLDGKIELESLPNESWGGVNVRTGAKNLRDLMLGVADKANEVYSAKHKERMLELLVEQEKVEKTIAEREALDRDLTRDESHGLEHARRKKEMIDSELEALDAKIKDVDAAFSNENYFTHIHHMTINDLARGEGQVRRDGTLPEYAMSRFLKERTSEQGPIYNALLALDAYLPSVSRTMHLQPALELIAKQDAAGNLTPMQAKVLSQMVSKHLGYPLDGEKLTRGVVRDRALYLAEREGKLLPEEYRAAQGSAGLAKLRRGMTSLISMQTQVLSGPLDLVRVASIMSRPEPGAGGKVRKSGEAAAKLGRAYADMVASQPEVMRAMWNRVRNDVAGEGPLESSHIFDAVLRGLREYDGVGVQRAERVVSKVHDATLIAMRASTTWATGTVWSANYKQARRTGGDHATASRFADAAVRNWQFEGGSVTGFQATSGLSNWMPLTRHPMRSTRWFYNELVKGPDKYVAAVYMMQAVGINEMAEAMGVDITHLLAPIGFSTGPLFSMIEDFSMHASQGNFDQAAKVLGKYVALRTQYNGPLDAMDWFADEVAGEDDE